MEEKIEEKQEEKIEEKQEETQEDDVAKLISDVKKQYEEKINTLMAKNKKAIEERDSVIKQLLDGESTAAPESIADKINAKRQYKKW